MATPRANFRRPRDETPSLLQFVVLSMLLHALAILLFGTPSGGGMRGGKAWWGSLQVTLQAPLPGADLGVKPERTAEPAVPRESLVKQWLPAPPARPDAGVEAAPQAAPPPREPRTRVPPAALPRLDLEAPTAVDKPVVPAPAPAEPIAPDLPNVPTPLLEPVVPSKPRGELAPPPELPPREAPAVPTPLLERVAPVRPQPEPAAQVEPPPREAPIVPTPLLEPIAPSGFARELAPAVPLPPQEAPAVPAPQGERTDAPEQRPVPAETRTTRESAPPERGAPPRMERAPATNAEPAFRPGGAAPDMGRDPFKSPRDAATPSEPGSAPRIDLEAARKRAREMAREGSGQRALLPFPMPPKEERKSKEAIAIEKALKPDCRNAYADMGLLAVAPLVLNAFGEGNCRW
jgi:hypothetical protein